MSLTKNQARQRIIQAVNRFKLSISYGTAYTPTLVSNRQINWAVFIARQNHLVDDDTLIAAGFNPQ